jgi:hypothetical protein
MLHATYMGGNRVDSRLLVVESQIASLTPDLSFDHNLCFKCPNVQCEHILDICVLINFQCCKELFQPMGFDPCNCALKIRESIWDSNSHNGSSLGSVKVHSLTLFALPRACDVTPRSPSWPTTLQPLALVVSPRLGLRHLACTPRENGLEIGLTIEVGANVSTTSTLGWKGLLGGSNVGGNVIDTTILGLIS